MRLAVCDDEEYIIIEMKKLLKLFINNKIEVDFFDSGEALLKSYQRGEQYDVVFLDVQMNGINGIETAEIIRQTDKRVLIIFMTNLLEYAVKGYSVRAFDYIIKPITYEKLDLLIHSVTNELEEVTKRFYLVECNGEKKPILMADIIYMESHGRKLYVITAKSVSEHYASISEESQRLKDYGFVRVNKSFIVNLRHIVRMEHRDIELSNGILLEISHSRYRSIFNEYTDYISGLCV